MISSRSVWICSNITICMSWQQFHYHKMILGYNWLRSVASLSAFSFPLLRSAYIAYMPLSFGSGVYALLVRVVIGLVWHRSIKPFLRPLHFFPYLLSLQHAPKMNGSRKGQLVWSERRRRRSWRTLGALFGCPASAPDPEVIHREV